MTSQASELVDMRVDQVGSLLRPETLKSAFYEFASGNMSESDFDAAQGAAIEAVIAKQESIGLPVVTDGEYRRAVFMQSFAEIRGFEQWAAGWSSVLAVDTDDEDQGEDGGPMDPGLSFRQPATQRLALEYNRPLAEFKFAQAATERPVKTTLIGPDRIIQGFDAEQSKSVYASEDEFLSDVVAVEREIIAGLADAGCQYVQIDAPSYTRFVDQRHLADMRARGESPQDVIERSIEADNAVIAGHDGVVFGVHLCRGNRQSMWHREGAYDEIAEVLFTKLNHDRLLLEYDTPRAGTFEPLRFVPGDKQVVLGLITTKTGQIETPEVLLRRIDEATHYIAPEQLAISPQCGFASVIEGNRLTEDEQWRKLELMMEVADRAWT